MNAPDRTQWLAERRLGIGGSDISVLLGLSPFRSQYDLWLDKTCRESSFDPSPEAAERMMWGNLLEATVGQIWADKTGHKIQRINTPLVDPECTIARVNLDRAVVQPGSRARWDEKEQRLAGALGVLEIKTANAFAANSADWGDEGTDEIPEHYWTQVQWELGIARLELGHVAVLFGGQQLRTYKIQADRDLYLEMRAAAADWWERHVVADTPPAPETEDDARRRWPAHAAGKSMAVSTELASQVEALRALRAQAKTIEEQEQALRDSICVAFGDAEEITFGGRKLATWKANKPSKETNWQALAEFMKPQPDTVSQFTSTVPGARVLRLSTTKE